MFPTLVVASLASVVSAKEWKVIDGTTATILLPTLMSTVCVEDI